MCKSRATDTALMKLLGKIFGLTPVLFAWLLLPATAFAASVVLDWGPSADPDLSGYKVYYQANSSSLPFNGTGAAEGSAPIDEGDVTSATIDGLDPNNSYFFAVTAYNFDGVESSFSNVIEIKESVAPVISLTSPANNSPVNGIVSIKADASDNVGVDKVQFFVNGTQVAETAVSPYAFSWDTTSLTSGTYTLSAKAFDAAGNEGDSGSLVVTINGDTVPPAVSLTAPTNNGSAGGTVVITASATDNVGVTRTEVYVDGALALSSNQNPVNYSWNTATASNGGHVLSAKAYDAAGNMGVSPSFSLTVFNDTTAPVVSLATPAASGGSVSGLVSVTANASDNVEVSKVEFYVNGALKASSASAPYGFSWSTGALANGAYTLGAKAYDAAGNVGQAANVIVNVLNDTAAPTVTAFSMPANANSTKVAVSSFTASDSVGVTGYLITESASAPASSAPGWAPTAPATFTFSGTNVRTAYAWVKDAAGNVSASKAASVLVDTTLPVIKSMSLIRGSSTVTVKATAADNVAVAKLQLYVDNVLQSETPGGSLSYVWAVTYHGTHTITVKAYDAAGNMRSQSLSIYK